MQIAFLGTGLMGAPMAQNLLNRWSTVTVWNRTRDKAEGLASQGANVADTAAEAVQGADIVITMVSDGTVGCSLVQNEQMRQALRPNVVWIDMSSAKPEEARQQSESLKAIGVHHLDGPVSGGVAGAKAASSPSWSGGEADVFARAEPVMQPMGRATHVGPSGAGQLAKLANQAIVGVTIGAVAEAILFLRETGADPSAVRAALKGGFADSTILQMHGARMTEGNFDPGGPCHLQLKDLRNVLGAADNANLRLPMVQSTHDRYARLVADMDGETKDHSALFLELCDLNGLKG